MKKKYFIQQYLQEEYLHGGVGGTDAEKILLEKGFRPIFFPYQRNFSPWAKAARFFYLLKILFTVERNAIIVFLFPLYARMNILLLRWLRWRNKAKIICFIADINGLKDGNSQLLAHEIAFLKKFAYFIVHNRSMGKWLKANISETAISESIGFFDFLTPVVSKQRELSGNIAFAGNLEKSPFLEKLPELNKEGRELHFHLYGPGQTAAMTASDNISYHGILNPYELPAKITGSFGLLWDGESIDGPGGSIGDYMQYISHHKLSLYILSGLPVIAPVFAGSADLINDYRIGFTVNNLGEIQDKIKALSPDDYRQMQINMQPLAAKISRGECLGAAIDRLLKKMPGT